MGFTGARIAQAIGQGLPGFGAQLQRLAEEDRRRMEAEQAASTEQQRFDQTLDLDRQQLALAIRAQQAEEKRAALAAKAEPEVNWSTVETADGIFERNPRTGQVRPLSYNGEQLRPRAPTPPLSITSPNWQTLTPQEGPVLQINPQTGDTREVRTPGGQPLTRSRPVPQAVQQRVIEGQMRISQIDRAIAAMQGAPNATGLRGYVPDFILQRADPEGVSARAEIADLGSMTILDRSGAAVQAAEFERLVPFIPSDTDSPEVVQRKLQRFREIAQEELQLYQAGQAAAGAFDGDDLEAGYQAAQGGGF